jgi:AcrR family transcriptional regulator
VSEPALQALRRVPRQTRGRERVRRVLAAADRVLAGEGASALTTTRVAEVANVSVGSLYQYFPDKEAIVEALALGYMGELEQLMAGLAEAAQSEPFDDPAGDILDAFAAAFRGRPGFRALWFGGLRTEELRDATRPTRHVIAASLARALSAQAPRADGDRVRAVSRATVLVADGLLREAFRLDPDGDQEVLEEGRRLLRGYLRDQLGLARRRLAV